MSNFKVGDKVRRTAESVRDLPFGSEHTVVGLEEDGMFLCLEGLGGGWSEQNFELVEPGASTPGVVYEVGKTYSYLDSVRTCIAFTSKGLPLFEREDGTVFEKNGGVEFKEVVKPLVGKLWANIYGISAFDSTHSSKEEADRNANKGRIACVEVNWTEGEGLEKPEGREGSFAAGL